VDNSQKVSLLNSKGINRKFCHPDYPSIANAPQYYIIHTLPVLLLFSFFGVVYAPKMKITTRQAMYV